MCPASQLGVSGRKSLYHGHERSVLAEQLLRSASRIPHEELRGKIAAVKGLRMPFCSPQATNLRICDS